MPAAVVAAADERRFEQIELFGFQLSRRGIRPASTRRPPTYEQWQQLGDYLAWAEASTPWLIAAWLEYGEATFNEKASQAADATGFQLDTIKQYEWVAKKIAPDDRDPDLSWSHHRAVVDLPASQQRRMLRRAKAEGWSVKELQREVRLLKAPAEQADTTCWLLVQCRSQRDRERLAKSLEKEGREVKIP